MAAGEGFCQGMSHEYVVVVVQVEVLLLLKALQKSISGATSLPGPRWGLNWQIFGQSLRTEKFVKR